MRDIKFLLENDLDIVFSTLDEKQILEYIENAKFLGITKIGLIISKDYRNKKELEEQKKKVMAIFLESQIELFWITSKRKERGDYSFINLKETTKNTRDVVASSNYDIIVGFEWLGYADFIHHRNSGLNHIIATIGKEKDKLLAFSFSDLLKSSPKKRAKIIGRVKQNKMLCKKSKVDYQIFSFAKKPYEMRRLEDMRAVFI